jgi:hypothetical protein
MFCFIGGVIDAIADLGVSVIRLAAVVFFLFVLLRGLRVMWRAHMLDRKAKKVRITK